MLFLYRSFTFLSFFFLFIHSNSHSTPSDTHSPYEVELRKLATAPEWLMLLGYERKSGGSFSKKSAIVSQDFFLAESGSTDPYEELIATLNSFNAPVDMSRVSEHSQCRFRGRFIWLKRVLRLEEKLNELAVCTEYVEWAKVESVESLSIVFATGYLGNPASYYGHLLLKINSIEGGKNLSLEDVSVNYGAAIPSGEGMVAYIAKGLLGMYDSGFTHQQYFYHSHNYGENELRNLWEYELNLSPDDVELILAHTWELLGRKYKYLFFDKNCAYRMAELVSLAEGVDIVPAGDRWVLPQGILHDLNQKKEDGFPLIKEVKYQPSRQSRLYHRFSVLSRDEIVIVKELIENGADYSIQMFNDAELESKYNIIDTLLDYYQYMIIKESEDNGSEYHQAYNSSLAMRFRLPPHNPPREYSLIDRPHDDRNISYLSTTFKTVKGSSSNRLGLTLRPAYYDQLDYGSAHVRHAELKMGEVSLDVMDKELFLDSLTLVSIKAVNPAATGLPNDGGAAWLLKVGLDQFENNCAPECLIPRAESGVGYSVSLSDSDILITGYLLAGVQENTHQYGMFDGAAQVDLLADLGGGFRLKASSRLSRALLEEKKERMFSSVSIRKSVSKQWDIRLNAISGADKQMNVSIGRYW